MDLGKGRVARQPVKNMFYVLANITRQARSKQDKYQQDDVKSFDPKFIPTESEDSSVL